MKTQQPCKKVSGCWPSRHTENLEYEFRLFWTIPWFDLTSQFFTPFIILLLERITFYEKKFHGNDYFDLSNTLLRLKDIKVLFYAQQETKENQTLLFSRKATLKFLVSL